MATLGDQLRHNDVRERVGQAMADVPWNIADLAREADVDPGTVGDFLNGSRWPQAATRSKIARALGWSADSIDRLARGEDVVYIKGSSETVAANDQDAGVLLSMPPDALEGLSPAEREEVITAAKLSALEKAREIRRRLGE